MIRSTFHYFQADLNPGKNITLQDFISEYKKATTLCVDYIWDLKLEWSPGKIWDMEKDFLDCPTMISTTSIGYSGKLSSRALKCAATQACGIVRALSEKRVKDLNKKAWIESLGKRVGSSLQNRLNKPLSKPDCSVINCELNSVCLDLLFEKGKFFDGFLNLKSLWSKISGYNRGFKVRIPIKHYRKSKKWRDFKDSKLLNSIMLNDKSVTLRWDIPTPKIRKDGKTVAVDQGKLACFTASDGQGSIKDKHGHDLNSIIHKLSRKRSGSGSFKKAVEHRFNYVNWSIKSLNLSGIKEIKLEDIQHITYGRNVSRELKHWTNTTIKDSFSKVCEEAGVLFTLVPNEFNSQRCSLCGWVQKANRSGKVFKCRKCAQEGDADSNASQNILVRDTLYSLPYGFRRHRLNLKGFYWNPGGLFDGLGQELTVPVVPREELSNIL